MCHVDQIKCIKDENDEMLAEAAHIKLRYQTYSPKLLKKEGDKDIMSEQLELAFEETFDQILGTINL